jgi:hypothetical protein
MINRNILTRHKIVLFLYVILAIILLNIISVVVRIKKVNFLNISSFAYNKYCIEVEDAKTYSFYTLYPLVIYTELGNIYFKRFENFTLKVYNKNSSYIILYGFDDKKINHDLRLFEKELGFINYIEIDENGYIYIEIPYSQYQFDIDGFKDSAWKISYRKILNEIILHGKYYDSILTLDGKIKIIRNNIP